MIRIIGCFLLVIGISSYSFCQNTAFTLGISQRTERSTFQNNEFVKNTNNYLFAGWQLTQEKSSWEIGFSFYMEKLNIDSYSNDTSGDEYSYYSNKVFSKAKVSYNYLGINTQRVRTLIEKSAFKLNIGCFLHLEKLLHEKESNHSQYSSEYRLVTYPGLESENTITSSTTNERFDAVLLKEMFWSFGITIAPRIERKNYYVSPYFSLGFHPKWRVHDNMAERTHTSLRRTYLNTNNDISERRNFYVFQEVGLIIGRNNKKK